MKSFALFLSLVLAIAASTNAQAHRRLRKSINDPTQVNAQYQDLASEVSGRALNRVLRQHGDEMAKSKAIEESKPVEEYKERKLQFSDTGFGVLEGISETFEDERERKRVTSIITGGIALAYQTIIETVAILFSDGGIFGGNFFNLPLFGSNPEEPEDEVVEEDVIEVEDEVEMSLSMSMSMYLSMPI